MCVCVCVCVCACVCVCVCVCVCLGVFSLSTHTNHSSWSVISTGGAARAAPRVFQGPQSFLLCRHSQALGCLWPCPSGGPPACLSCAGTGSREEEKKGRKKEGREGRREGGDADTDAILSLQSLKS